MTLSALFEKVDISLADADAARGAGAFRRPGADRARLRAAPAARQLAIDARDPRRLGLTTTKDVLEAMANGEGPKDMLVTLGYSGWAAGQLEDEIAQNGWLTVAGRPEVIFDTPIEERSGGAALLGIDFSRLSHEVGHA